MNGSNYFHIILRLVILNPIGYLIGVILNTSILKYKMNY